MSTNWISKLGRELARVFSWQMPAGCVDYFDRESEKLKVHVDRAQGIQAAAVELLARAIASFSSDLSVDG